MDGSLGKIQNHSRSLNLISSPRRGVIIDIVLKWFSFEVLSVAGGIRWVSRKVHTDNPSPRKV